MLSQRLDESLALMRLHTLPNCQRARTLRCSAFADSRLIRILFPIPITYRSLRSPQVFYTPLVALTTLGILVAGSTLSTRLAIIFLTVSIASGSRSSRIRRAPVETRVFQRFCRGVAAAHVPFRITPIQHTIVDRDGGEGTRTPDPLLAKQVLYQLSYTPGCDRLPNRPLLGVPGFEPGTSALSELRSSQLSYTPDSTVDHDYSDSTTNAKAKPLGLALDRHKLYPGELPEDRVLASWGGDGVNHRRRSSLCFNKQRNTKRLVASVNAHLPLFSRRDSTDRPEVPTAHGYCARSSTSKNSFPDRSNGIR